MNKPLLKLHFTTLSEKGNIMNHIIKDNIEVTVWATELGVQEEA